MNRDSKLATKGISVRLGKWAKSLVRFIRFVTSWVPLTPLGVVAIPILTLLLLFYGFDRQDKILLAVSISGLALLGVMLGAVILATLGLWLRREKAEEIPLDLEAGVAAETGYRVRLLGWLPLVKLEWSWVETNGAQVRVFSRWGSLREEVTPTERAARPNIVRRFVVSDLFGLTRFSFCKRQTRDLHICPNRGNLQKLELVPQHDVGDEIGHPLGSPHGDLLEMRGYSPGDPLKRILWKVYARTGRLLVRMPERAVKPCERTMAYVVAGAADEATAGVARRVLEAGMLGADFLFAADGAEVPTLNVDEAIRQIVRSANARLEAAAGLDKFLALGEAEGIRACCLFVPAQPGDWLGRVAVLVASHPWPFRVLVGVDGLLTGKKRSWLKKLLMSNKPAAGSKPADVRKVVDVLRQAGALVTLVNRLTGEIVQVDAAVEPRITLQAIGA